MRRCALRAAGVTHHVCCPGQEAGILDGGEVSDMKVHRLYPLGIECAHCERWHRLKDAYEHAEEFHPECEYCAAEAKLCRALLHDAAVAVSSRGWPTFTLGV